jgi:NADP-dependent 3-hydroxy acid dehydrogenase YdfG
MSNNIEGKVVVIITGASSGLAMLKSDAEEGTCQRGRML